ncbi:MAG: hypothetical protein ACK55V_16285, partial [Alphaproteobacteria bacterium]
INDAPAVANGRALTGAWIETLPTRCFLKTASVAPSRARGLKLLHAATRLLCGSSRPHGRVDFNILGTHSG